MRIESRRQPTLDRPAVYQIKVPGFLDAARLDWLGGLRVETGTDETGLPVTTLTGSVDQAALIGLLRRLYSLGLPLISVNFMEGQ